MEEENRGGSPNHGSRGKLHKNLDSWLSKTSDLLLCYLLCTCATHKYCSDVTVIFVLNYGVTHILCHYVPHVIKLS